MNAKNVKKEKVTCTNCGHVINLKNDNYMDALERARIKLKNEMGFGIKEEYETNKKERNDKENN